MVKIELLIPLSYFGIVRTSSTETVKIAHFVLFCLLLLLIIIIIIIMALQYRKYE